MKIHTTNYFNSFIRVAEDCKKVIAEIPPLKLDKQKSIARMQYEKLIDNPYKFTSDEILFDIHVERKGISDLSLEHERESFFSMGQACLRTSPLAKTYGWGFHHDENSKVAIVGFDDIKYKEFLNDKNLNQINAMRSNR